jgi:guanylate kinase
MSKSKYCIINGAGRQCSSCGTIRCIPGKLVLIIGPSGVGKSVILRELKKRHPEIVFPRSATTRKRRAGEGDELYRFVSDEEFDRLIEQGELLEWAVVHGGARYGTIASEILPAIDAGKIVVREVDVQGFESIRSHRHFRGEGAAYPLLSLFILPENKEQLIEHIQKRAPIAGEELTRRIASVERELTYAENCDKRVINREGHLKQTIGEVEHLLGLGE